MKKLKQLGFAMLVGISTVLINGCAKDGETGPAGKNGIDGQDGNANVTGTNSVTVTAGDWTLSSGYYSTGFTNTDITQAIVDKGIVMVYEKLGTQWQALPYLNDDQSRDFTFGVGTVTIWAHNADLTTPTNPGTQTYRIVIISASNLAAHPEVDFRNYKQVQTAFGL